MTMKTCSNSFQASSPGQYNGAKLILKKHCYYVSLTFHEIFPKFFVFIIRNFLSKDKNAISERLSTHCVPKMCHALLVLMTQQMLNIQLSSLTKLVFYCFDVKSFSSKIWNSCVLMIISSDLDLRHQKLQIRVTYKWTLKSNKPVVWV